jgi:50S ribosomal protein L16 3-hydroxylase
MDVNAPLALLGGLSPTAFMKRHWQKRPLLVRQAWPGAAPPLQRAALFALAGQEGVESRLVQRGDPKPGDAGWQVRTGPLPRRALPPRARPGWTLLVQGLDLHVPQARALLERFRFLPDARLDDVMVSWASEGGGVGPHVDSYDVFLLQVEGRRRWQWAPAVDEACIEGAPLKLLRHFEPIEENVLEPGDLLYLPPRWGHDGVAVGGECMTCSVGFRAPSAGELARELLLRLADDAEAGGALYRDPRQLATATPAALPAGLLGFAQKAIARALSDHKALPRLLGEILSEPKPQTWFCGRGGRGDAPVRLDAGTRMLYDERHVFINGEAFEATGRDARLMRLLADGRRLAANDCRRLSVPARQLLDGWVEAGWVHAGPA